MVHKFLRGKRLKGKFTYRTQISKYKTRRVNDVPKPQLEISRKRFSYVDAKVWNEIQKEIGNVESTHFFKLKMETYLMDQ